MANRAAGRGSILFAWPDSVNERNAFELAIPRWGGFFDAGDLAAEDPGIVTITRDERPPIAITFFGFRIMVGMGLVMLALSWLGVLLRSIGRLETSRWFLRCVFLCFPTGFVGLISGWFTGEVGRQPWVVYGIIYSFGFVYLYRLLREGPGAPGAGIGGASAKRPLAAAGAAETAPVWDGNETWLILVGASLFGVFPMVYAIFLPTFYLPVTLLLFALIFRGVAFEFRYRSEKRRRLWDRGFFLGSLIAAFVQGAAIGTLIQELPVINGRYAGGSFEWVSGFSIVCGVGLVMGYGLLGASWLVVKTSGALRRLGLRSSRTTADGCARGAGLDIVLCAFHRASNRRALVGKPLAHCTTGRRHGRAFLRLSQARC